MFKNLEEKQLLELNGGGFAYDVGRVIRFIGISIANGGGTPALGTTALGVEMARMDWEINEATK